MRQLSMHACSSSTGVAPAQCMLGTLACAHSWYSPPALAYSGTPPPVHVCSNPSHPGGQCWHGTLQDPRQPQPSWEDSPVWCGPGHSVLASTSAPNNLPKPLSTVYKWNIPPRPGEVVVWPNS